MQEQKSDREAVLLSMGFDLHTGSISGLAVLDVVKGDTSLAFSGYGEFTPITVRSDTVIGNAHLERDQR